MKDNAVITVKNLDKIYKLYDKPIDRLKEAISFSGKKYHKNFYALKDVNLSIEDKMCVGIIGTNGSGKSTFLKIITGVLSQTSGEVTVNGRISALLELGIGFNMEYTGIENIYLSGTIMGFTKEQMDLKISDIIEFADIGEFIYQPVKTYSSGMFARLAFSVAISVDPEILIVDEALSVGDVKFQQKCYRRIEEFKENRTILLVTHDMGAITKFCDKVIWIEKGKLMDYGDPITISKKYQAYILNYNLELLEKKELDNNNLVKSVAMKKDYMNINMTFKNFETFGDMKAQITGIGMFKSKTKERVEYVYPNTEVSVVLKVKNNTYIEDEIVGFTVKDRLSNIVFQTNSFELSENLSGKIGEYIYEFKFIIPELNTGEYTISPAVASGTQVNHIQHNWIHDAYVFRVVSNNVSKLEGYMYISNIEFSIL